MWLKIEFWARFVRYPFILMAVVVFVANNLGAFRDNQVWMWVFFGSGILWLLATAYVEIREADRISLRLKDAALAQARPSRHQGQGGDRMAVKWLRRHAAEVATVVALGATIALYGIPSRPVWAMALVPVPPVAMWIARLIERKGHDNENLIRQLHPLVKDIKDLEWSIRGFARDLIAIPAVRYELGGFGVDGWSYYIETLGDQQLGALSLLERDLRDADPYKEAHMNAAITALYKILGRVLAAESHVCSSLCKKISSLPTEYSDRWEYIRMTHLRLATQFGSLKSILSQKGHGDLFDTFISQPPQSL